MLTTTTTTTASGTTSVSDVAAHRAFLLLRTIFTVAPILFGLDKFFDILTNWDKYLAPWINNIMPGDAHQFMMFVGVVEIIAGIVVALAPKYGAIVVTLWLLGIIVNLVSMGQYYDVALRDFGLLVGALALFFLAPMPHFGHRAERASH